MNFPGASVFLRTLYDCFQEALSSPRTHTIFQETPISRTHRHFSERYPLSNRYFVKDLGDCV